MSVVRRIAIGQNHKSAEVLNQATDDIQTLSGLTLGATFPGFVNYPTLTGEVGVTSNLYPVGDARRHGVPTNGTSDATTALQNGLDSVSALGGGVLFVPAGTYKYTKLSVAANVTLRGAGRGATTFVRSALGSEGNNTKLFGIRLTGNFARLEHCSVKGLWNPASPTTQTFDINIAPVGDNVIHTTIFNVETYNAHLGYVVGGVIGDPVATWGGQSYHEANACYAHDTYDLGFALVAKDRTTGIGVGCRVVNCEQSDSYATGGIEIRFQQDAQVVGFKTKNNTDSSLGCGIRLEQTSGALITNVSALNCYMPVQIINDSDSCVVDGLVARSCYHGAYLRNASDIRLANLRLIGCTRTAVYLDYADGTAWTTFNERITLDGFLISGAGSGTGTAVLGGVAVQGAGHTEANVSRNGTGLRILNGRIRQSYSRGIFIQAGGQFEVGNVVLEDNGTGVADGTGLYVTNPTPNSVADTTAPANGWAHDLFFINTGSQPNTINDGTGTAFNRFTQLGDFRQIGAATYQTDNSYTTGKTVNGGIQIGSAGNSITLVKKYSQTLTPASVPAASSAEQQYTVTGLAVGDQVIVTPPVGVNNIGITAAWVSATNTLSLRFTNPTAGALTPTSGTYAVLAFR